MVQQQVVEILNYSDAVFVKVTEGAMEVIIPDGRGIRFNNDGSFDPFVD